MLLFLQYHTFWKIGILMNYQYAYWAKLEKIKKTTLGMLLYPLKISINKEKVQDKMKLHDSFLCRRYFEKH